MKRKKLLITVGCSLIEGCGCFPKVLLDKYIDTTTPFSFDELTHQSKEYFRLNSIGSHLGKLLEYDTHLNFGIGGSSINQQVDVFLKNYELYDLDNYDVTLFLLITFSSRFAFYINGKVHVLQNYEFRLTKSFSEIQKNENLKEDTILDQVKYFNVFKSISKLNNWNFIYGCADENDVDIWKDILDGDLIKNFINLGVDNNQIIPYGYFSQNPYLTSTPYDNHPNQYGYKHIANIIYKWICKYNPEYIDFSITENTPYTIIDGVNNKIIQNKFV